MSFQAQDSDLSRIGRAEPGDSVAVAGLTADCLRAALALAEASRGAFDPVLPGATWRDLSVTDRLVTVARPLRVDLSGIAKGFAVDRACDVLRAHGCEHGRVNAGGDLRLFGRGEAIAFAPFAPAPPAAVFIEDGALASSDVAGAIAEHDGPQHRDGRSGDPLPPRFAGVAAPLCRDADALTKIVLALGRNAAPLLASAGAVAYVHDDRGWWGIGDDG